MDPITLTVAFKGFGMLLVIAGGILIARYGYHLYKDGAGHGRDQAAISIGKVTINAHSAGSIVMSTAFLWAFAGVLLSPNMEKKGDEIRIYSVMTPTGDLEAVALTMKSTDHISIKSNPEKLEKLLGEAVLNESRKGDALPLARLDGKAAAIDMSSIKAVRSGTGDFMLLTKISAGGKTAALKYAAMLDHEKITFVPAGFDSTAPKP